MERHITYTGTDSFGRELFRESSEGGRILVCVENNHEARVRAGDLRTKRPADDPEGEPDARLDPADIIVIDNAQERGLDPAARFNYMLLDRLRSDCEYFLGAGFGCEKHLWAGSVEGQIAKMRSLLAELPEQPEWLTPEQVDRYETRMKVARDFRPINTL